MSLVLNTGVYPPLLETRKLMLERAGHTVITAPEESQVVAACQRYRFEVAVIGQSASPEYKRHIFNLVRQHCSSAKILELVTADTTQVLDDADSCLELHPMAPHELAQRVSELAKGAKGTKGAKGKGAA